MGPNITLDYPQPYNKIGDGPEGPEVRTVADKLFPHLINRYITDLEVDEKAKLSGFEDFNYPCLITNVDTIGKKIIITCLYHNVYQKIVVSLGMTGRLQYTPGPHTHIHFTISTTKLFSNCLLVLKSLDLYFDDTRYFGSVKLITDDSFFDSLGPDVLDHALHTPLTFDQWKDRFIVKPTWRLCKALLDQSIVSGIGNYLVSEILYLSNLHPERTIGSLSDDEMERMRAAAHYIIVQSYSHGGFTLESFISPDGAIGTYPALIYGRKVDNDGLAITAIKTSNGRTTYIVPSKQQL